jgi:hypothetical protein
MRPIHKAITAAVERPTRSPVTMRNPRPAALLIEMAAASRGNTIAAATTSPPTNDPPARATRSPAGIEPSRQDTRASPQASAIVARRFGGGGALGRSGDAASGSLEGVGLADDGCCEDCAASEIKLGSVPTSDISREPICNPREAP